MKVVSFNAVQELVNIPFDMTFIYASYIRTSSIQQMYKIANSLCKSLNVGRVRWSGGGRGGGAARDFVQSFIYSKRKKVSCIIE